MRYFFVSYQITSDNGKSFQFGDVTFEAKFYPSKNDIRDMVSKENYSNPIIMNIVEMNKDDYDRFVSLTNMTNFQS